MALALSWLPRQAMHYDCSCSPCRGAGSGLLPSRARTKASGPWVCVVREERRMEEAGWTVAWIGEEDWVGWRMLQTAESSDKRPTECHGANGMAVISGPLSCVLLQQRWQLESGLAWKLGLSLFILLYLLNDSDLLPLFVLMGSCFPHGITESVHVKLKGQIWIWAGDNLEKNY